MKDIDKTEAPEISGGFSPYDNGCIPTTTFPNDFPQNPALPPSPDPLEDNYGPYQYSGER